VVGSTLVALSGCATRATSDRAPYTHADSPEDAGRYLVLVGGCNDCHTPAWDASDGKLPTSAWLTGNSVGYRGPWGTSYPANLRLVVQEDTEDGWVRMFRAGRGLPPMPWQNYRTMHEDDLRAMYRFIRRLGPMGEEAPQNLPPGREPKTPVILLVPQPPGSTPPPQQAK
jgi:hypothetical protein